MILIMSLNFSLVQRMMTVFFSQTHRSLRGDVCVCVSAVSERELKSSL